MTDLIEAVIGNEPPVEELDPFVDHARLNARIDALGIGWAAHNIRVLDRNRTYLNWYSPAYNSRLGVHDQWPTAIRSADVGHERGSYNIARAVPEMWASLEAEELPTIRWEEQFLPTPAPSLDDQENQKRQEIYRAERLVARQVATMREQVLGREVRRAKLDRAYYRATVRKNVYGHAWVKVYPDLLRQRFRVEAKIDSATVYPVFSGWEDELELDAVLVVYRQSAPKAHARFPDAVPLDDTGTRVVDGGRYQPTVFPTDDAGRNYVWIEDYWVLDREYARPTQDGEPVQGRVVNALRANGKLVQVAEFPGWTRVPYFPIWNDDLRDQLGFSDVGTVIPFQDNFNRMLSEQSDVIHGEARPKFVHRSEGATGSVKLNDEGIINLDIDENVEQLAVHLDVFPTQVHGQQLTQLFGRVTGLANVVWGEITSAQNSGRALSTAWRATAARLIPRVFDASDFVEAIYGFMLDLMELYGWDDAPDLYQGNRDFALDWPNKEPRDFLEVTTDALNKLGAGVTDLQAAMEATGEGSPDEMIERVRAEYMDAVLHPDKAQAFLLLQRLKQQIQAEAQQAALQAAAGLAQITGQPPAGAPGPASLAAQQGQVQQAQAQAAAQAAPTRTEGQQQGPATARGAAGNPAQPSQTRFGTLVQDGQAMNRIINEGQL